MRGTGLGVRGKLFVGALLTIGVFGSVSGFYLERQLKRFLEDRIEAELLGYARSTSEQMPALAGREVAAVDALADRVGRATNARITIIAADGRVLGDSDLSVDEVASVENHGARPEVRDALGRGRGVSRRYSTTLRTEMVYVAVPASIAGARGSVRAAMPLIEVDEAIAGLRWMLGGAGVVGLLLAIVVSFFGSHFATRSVRELAQRAQALARGEAPRPLPVASTDELGGLAGSFNRVARELADAVSALAGERDRLNAILESMREAVLALDADGRIVLANGAAGALLGADAVALGRPLIEATRSPDLAQLVERASIEGADVRELELPRVGERRMLAHAAALRATGGVVLVLHDVTEMRRLEAMRRDFVANVSHELRTPISVIRAHGETLLDGGLEDGARARGFVEGISRNAERLSHLISDLLDIARVEAGELELRLGRLPLQPIVKRAVDAVARAARDKNLAVDTDLDEVTHVEADADALEQVLLNLLENAVRYTQPEGHVLVRARTFPGAVRLEVRDDGPGIEPKHRDRVFERFYRVDPGRSREMGGTGLGLSIVKHLVTAMGGEVGMEPGEPRGAVFWLTLPTA